MPRDEIMLLLGVQLSSEAISEGGPDLSVPVFGRGILFLFCFRFQFR